MRHLSEVLGCFCNAVIAENAGGKWRTICVKGPGLLNGIEMIAVNHHRACNVAQPLTRASTCCRGGFAIVAAARCCAGVRSDGQTSGES